MAGEALAREAADAREAVLARETAYTREAVLARETIHSREAILSRKTIWSRRAHSGNGNLPIVIFILKIFFPIGDFRKVVIPIKMVII